MAMFRFGRPSFFRRKNRAIVIFACVALLCLGLGGLLFLPKSDVFLEESEITILHKPSSLERPSDMNNGKVPGKPEKSEDKVIERHSDEYGVDKNVDDNLEELEREEKDVELKIGHELNPKLTDEQHKKIAEEIKAEKEKFIKEQAHEEGPLMSNGFLF